MQKHLITTLVVLTVAAFISFIVAFSVWIGVFFGEELNEIKYEYIPYIKTNCSYSFLNYNSDICCKETCDTIGCSSECHEYESCSLLIHQNETTNGIPCCKHEYHCCRECCEICQDCYHIGKNDFCEPKTCCKCCSSVNSFACQISCNTCYFLKYNVNYSTQGGDFISVKQDIRCDNEYCLNSTLKDKQDSHECFYNPNNLYQYSVSNDYETRIIPKEPYKMGIMYSFIGLACLSFILFVVGVIILVYCAFSISRSRAKITETIEITIKRYEQKGKY